MNEHNHTEELIYSLRKKITSQKELLKTLQINRRDANVGVSPSVKHTIANGFDVFYEDLNHVYFVVNGDQKIPLISVTTVIDLFTYFDAEGQSLRCANKKVYNCECLDKTNWDRLTIEDKQVRILLAWEQNATNSSEYGTASHTGCEYLAVYPDLETQTIYDALVLRYGPSAKPIIKSFIDGMRPVLKGFNDLGYVCISEPVLVDLEIGIAGQSDLVMINHHTKDIWVLDYKTNKERPTDARAYSKMLGFFEEFDSTAWIHYCIQLGLYATMLLQQYPCYKVSNLTLLWKNRETGAIEPIAIDVTYWLNVVGQFRNYLKQNSVSQLAHNVV